MSREERRECEGAGDLWESSTEETDATDMRLARIRLSPSSPGERLRTKEEEDFRCAYSCAGLAQLSRPMLAAQTEPSRSRP